MVNPLYFVPVLAFLLYYFVLKNPGMMRVVKKVNWGFIAFTMGLFSLFIGGSQPGQFSSLEVALNAPNLNGWLILLGAGLLLGSIFWFMEKR